MFYLIIHNNVEIIYTITYKHIITNIAYIIIYVLLKLLIDIHILLFYNYKIAIYIIKIAYSIIYTYINLIEDYKYNICC